MPIPRAAVLQDLSGFGRCSLSVAMPILSVMGVQCCPLPTAFLSAHTGFAGNTFLDMTEEMPKVSAHWKQLQITFDAIYSGFIGSENQIHVISDFISQFGSPKNTILVDPVMGDQGQTYRTYTPIMCQHMVELCTHADIITPNLTEACIILGEPYSARPTTQAESIRFLHRLSMHGKRSVVLTGIVPSEQEIGAGCFDRESGQIDFVFNRRIEGEYPGSGDVFASVVLGAFLSGDSLIAATTKAVDFVHDCVALTAQSRSDPQAGLLFEPFLAHLHSSK